MKTTINLAVLGTLITGIFGWIFAYNSILGGDGVGAGTLLIASALAFGFLALSVIGK